MATTEDIYKLFLQHPHISTDTRKIEKDGLFFALKGDKFDANTFAEQAIAAGAAYAIIDNPAYQIGEKYILVNDALIALQDLARYHRRRLTIPVIGLTGTNGKTTTKELINSVLSQHFKTLATQGNLNNHIGVPLTILTISSSHEIAVIEMGANHQKEIELLCSIAQPTHGMITNVGKAHLEGFGGIEGVKKGKGELYDYLLGESGSPKVRKSERQNEVGVAFVNSDNPVLLEMQAARKLENVVYYGTGTDKNLITGSIVDNSPYLSLQWTKNQSGDSHRLQTQLTGAYNLDNILAAICIGVYFKLNADEINKGIESYHPQNNRSQIVQTITNTLICDYYNANPSSMFAAIENMERISAERKVLILGDMFELGEEAATEHEAVIEKAMSAPVELRIFIGEEFFLGRPKQKKFGAEKSTNANHLSDFRTPDSYRDGLSDSIFYQTVEEAIRGLETTPVKNATILIKGSRGMALERLAGLF